MVRATLKGRWTGLGRLACSAVVGFFFIFHLRFFCFYILKFSVFESNFKPEFMPQNLMHRQNSRMMQSKILYELFYSSN
jgi:hypothetical protein